MKQLDLFEWTNTPKDTQQIGKPCRHCLEWDNFRLEDSWWDAEYDFKQYRCYTTIKDELDYGIAECGGTETVTKQRRGDYE